MRGDDNRTGALFSYVDLEARIRRDHPLRAIRAIVNEALSALEREFAALYSPIGRPSIPPEKLLRAMLLQAFYSIRSERLLMERLEYDLLFRWFVGIGIDDAAWDHSVFSKNRDRLLEGEIRSGDRLIPERELSAQLGVSRPIVREALRALEEAGLVRTEKNRGMFVREISFEEADEIYELREAMAEKGLGTPATRATPFQVQAEAGNVKIVDGPWVEAFLDELIGFPGASHDDRVDACSAAFDELLRFVQSSGMAGPIQVY